MEKLVAKIRKREAKRRKTMVVQEDDDVTPAGQ